MWEAVAVVIILVIMVNAIIEWMVYKRPVTIQKVVIPPQYRRVTKAEICKGCGATLHYGHIVWGDFDTVSCVYCGRMTLPTDVQWMVRQWSLTRERQHLVLHMLVTGGKMNTNTGVMENQETVEYIINKLVKEVEGGGSLRATLIPCSKNHSGKPMIVVSDAPLVLNDGTEDVTIWHLEISSDGIFAYTFDDGVS